MKPRLVLAGMDQEGQRHAPVRQGWNALRDTIFENQKKLFIRQADVYAAYLAWPLDASAATRLVAARPSV